MEEIRLPSLKLGNFKSTLSGRSTPRGSPTSRRLHSGRTPRRDTRSSGGIGQWFRSSRLVYWLLLITLWTYLGFYVQSRWAHGDDDNKEGFLAFGRRSSSEIRGLTKNARRELIANSSFHAVGNDTKPNQVDVNKRIDVILTKKETGASTRSLSSKSSSKKSNRRSRRNPRGKTRGKPKKKAGIEGDDIDGQEQELPKTNTTFGKLFGPFGPMEDRILEWSPEKRAGTCDRKSDFARLVWSRRFILVFHELSLTGAPISMIELATELLSCGATVSAVVLSKKGGLMKELTRRRIKVVEDKADLSFKTAMKADLVIAGSAVCSSWIDQYMDHFPAGGSQIAWWIMENRREYFDRAKPVLNQVKQLIFLSEMQSQQWLTWCDEDQIKLRSQPVIVPLSVNDELAFVAGFSCSLNTPTFSPEKMMEKRQLLRQSVRKEMGLTDKDVLVMSLSSINPGKGQLLLIESASLLFEKDSGHDHPKLKKLKDFGKIHSVLSARHQLRGLPRKLSISRRRKMLSDNETREQDLKILIGSVGSKSNKIPYVKEILNFLSNHTNVSNSVLWTPATTRVASLYSAADVYVINSQGMGETFGRVTIEAMAFGLPVLGTDAGGTKEIVEHNVTGLLHPVGHPGNKILAQNLRFLVKNPSSRLQMGKEGHKKVEKMYLKRQMYRRFVDVLIRCMRPK